MENSSDYIVDCQACEGTGTVLRQKHRYPCPNCGGVGVQSSTLPRQLRKDEEKST